MGTARATIRAGICGFATVATGTADDDYGMRYDIETDCPRIQSLALALTQSDPINVLSEVRLRHEATVLVAGRDPRHGICVGCVVPPGLYKVMQVAAWLALPAASSIDLQAETL